MKKEETDLYMIGVCVYQELRRQRAYVEKYNTLLAKNGELDDQLAILKRLILLRKYLSRGGYALVLPFGVGDRVFMITQGEDGAVTYYETIVTKIHVEMDDKDEQIVSFECERGSFLLGDFEDTVFLAAADALQKCVELNV